MQIILLDNKKTNQATTPTHRAMFILGAKILFASCFYSKKVKLFSSLLHVWCLSVRKGCWAIHISLCRHSDGNITASHDPLPLLLLFFVWYIAQSLVYFSFLLSYPLLHAVSAERVAITTLLVRSIVWLTELTIQPPRMKEWKKFCKICWSRNVRCSLQLANLDQSSNP